MEEKWALFRIPSSKFAQVLDYPRNSLIANPLDPDDDLARVRQTFDLTRVVADQNNAPPGQQLELDQLLDQSAARWIKRARWFIEQQHLGVIEQRADEGEPLTFTRRQHGDGPVQRVGSQRNRSQQAGELGTRGCTLPGRGGGRQSRLKYRARRGRPPCGFSRTVPHKASPRRCWNFATLSPIEKNLARSCIKIGNRRLKVKPETLKGEVRANAWRRITTTAPSFASYETKTDREIPVVRLTPA